MIGRCYQNASHCSNDLCRANSTQIRAFYHSYTPVWESKPSSYGFSVLGCRLTLEFPIAKLTDYEEKLDELLASDNAFGWITAAHILTQKTRTEDEERYKAKLRLLRILYERRWEKQRVINLFNVIDWLMQLPELLNNKVWRELETIEEREKMQYVTSVERIGIAKGRVVGRVEGEARIPEKAA